MRERLSVFVLTLNEAANIERTLEAVRWARHVLVVDSGSTDATLAIAARFPNVELMHRDFDSHAGQANFALAALADSARGRDGDWVLALDADYVVTPALRERIESMVPPESHHGYCIPIQFCALGRPLRGSLYPPVVALYRRERARYVQYGHAHRVCVDGNVLPLPEALQHDDRKSVARWLATQQGYMQLEADMLERTPWRALRPSGKVRRAVVLAPVAAVPWCLLVKGLLLDGWPGLYYTLQRVIAESLLSLEIVRRRIERSGARSGRERRC